MRVFPIAAYAIAMMCACGADSNPVDPTVDAASADVGVDAEPLTHNLAVNFNEFDLWTSHAAYLRAFDARGQTRIAAWLLPMESSIRILDLTESAGSHAHEVVAFLDLDDDGILTPITDMLFAGRIFPGDPSSVELSPHSGAAIATMPSDDRLALQVHFVRFEHHLGMPLELRVTDAVSRADVSLVSIAGISADTFDVYVPNAVDANTSYQVRVFLDINQNGVYDAHGDFGANFLVDSDNTGLRFEHDHFDER
ncbi:MAG: hypothetical protein IPK60_01535 [Sandaracinaceae bacterium]|nr:hypothetical protein [Sandaracinaceae bacterium]